jgi:hypothetical protein
MDKYGKKIVARRMQRVVLWSTGQLISMVTGMVGLGSKPGMDNYGTTMRS